MSDTAKNTENKKVENVNNDQDQEISLIDLLAVLLKHKKMIIAVTGVAAVFAILFSILTIKLPPEKSPLPNKYTPQAHMLINDESSGGGISSMLSSSGLGSLANLSGISGSSGASYSSLAVYLTGTNSFLDTIVDKFNLLERYKITKSPRATSRKVLKQKLTAAYDSDSGVFTIAFTDIDPFFAQSVVNFAADYIEARFLEMGVDKNKLSKKNLEENIQNTYNDILSLQKRIKEKESSVSNGYNPAATQNIILDTSMLRLELSAKQEVYTQLKTQLEILKVSMASEKPIFQILEKAEIPDQKSGPSRGKLCIIITFAAFFISVFIAFFLNAIDNLKNDPEAIKKLSPKKKGTEK